MKPEDLQKLVETAMPYGKHKGVLIADLPGNYLNWFAREGFPKGEIGRPYARQRASRGAEAVLDAGREEARFQFAHD